jgi:hypothetical protein
MCWIQRSEEQAGKDGTHKNPTDLACLVPREPWDLFLDSGPGSAANVMAEDWGGHVRQHATGEARDLAMWMLEPFEAAPAAKLLDHGVGHSIEFELHGARSTDIGTPEGLINIFHV